MKKLNRLHTDRKLGGVCAGLGEYFDTDPIIFRLLFMFSVFFGGLGVLAYLVMWIMVPAKDGPETVVGGRSRLHLSDADRKLGGVCGGLGEYFAHDAIFFRVGFVILAFAGGSGILLYLALWLLLPRVPFAPAQTSAPI